MWSKLILCVLVGLAYASHNPGWKHNHEYVYQVRGRTLASLNQVSSNYSGIILRATLRVIPSPEGNLHAKIFNAQYADLHSKLKDDWKQEIPDSELNYRDIPLSSEPFKILMENGVVRKLVVDKSVTNWEANMIRGVVSQLQLDTEAQNVIDSYINLLTQEGSNNAVFKTMEKTVTGEAETLYEIQPLPDYILQTTPWLAPLRDREGEEQMTEIVKNKNFTHSKQRLAYHFGYEGIDGFDTNNAIADFFSRTLVSRAVVSGSLKSFTLQSAVTFDEISMNPSRDDKQRGSTNSIVNITLQSLKPLVEQFEEVPNPVYLDLVYRYNDPFGPDNAPQFTKQQRYRTDSDESSGSQEPYGVNYVRHKRSSESEEPSSAEESPLAVEKPDIDEPPASPLLPLTVGYNGQAINKIVNIKQNALTLAKQIGKEFQEPEKFSDRNTVGKFLLLASLLKLMNYNEIQEVAEQLYTPDKHGQEAATWVAYRDAAAQAGTGPALLNIVDWIRSKKIVENEAALVISSAAASARQPTEKYMRVFFQLIQNEELMAQQHLNQTLLLSYTTLVHQVYVDSGKSHNKYPVHSFGSFNTAAGRTFVKQEVIPHLRRKFEEAITAADTQKIHAYIRALGNVGHQRILQTFKPYLEGTKKASHFQRVMMVVALDKLAEAKSKVARSVLFKTYQNPREFEQVRVAAVYQLMRTHPSPAMLQRMARYTNIDTNNHVNSAVKSTINAAAELQQPQHAHLRAAAESAKPLLTAREFGVQHSQGHLRSYVVKQMELEYLQSLEFFAGYDSAVPKGLNYLLQGRFGGVTQTIVNLQSMVSSVEDLINVYEQQTSQYREDLIKKQAENSVNQQWTSDYTANLFKMQNEQREQLEGMVYLQVHSLEKIWSYDNHTIDNLTEVVRELEKELAKGRHVDFSKMSVYPESAIAFPTAWGLPFLYTYDRIVFTQFEGEFKASASPPIASNDGLQKPEKIQAQYEASGFISGRSQSQFGFFTPFNHKRYSAGYDKNFQVQLPRITANVTFDVKQQQVTTYIKNNERKSVQLAHYSSWPYTTQYDIYTPKPDIQIIRSENPQRINTVVGQKSTGIGFYLHLTSDKHIDYGSIFEKLRHEDPVSALLSPLLDDNIQHAEISFGIDASKTKTNMVAIHSGRQHAYSADAAAANADANVANGSGDIAKESLKRQQEFLKNVTANISSVHGEAVDAVVIFMGDKLIKYTTTLAGAKSNIDPKGRVLMQVLQDNQADQPTKLFVKSDSTTHNTNDLNLHHAIAMDSTISANIQASIEKSNEKPAQISASVKLSKSEERKQYLREQPQYKVCERQMQEGNNQLPACAMLTAQANLLDQFDFKIDYSDIDLSVVNRTYKLYSAFRQYLYPRVSEDIMIGDYQNNRKLNIEGQFSPDLSRVNVSIQSEYGYAEIQDAVIGDWARTVVVPNPVYHLRARIAGHAFKYDTYRPICVVDKSAVSTIDNKTYPISVGQNKVVMLHYVPRRPSSIQGQPEQTVVEQLNQQVEGYIAYVSASDDNQSQKEFKMVIQSPKTLAKAIDVTLKPPGSSGYPRLFVQGEEIIYDNDVPHIYDDYMQVYKLPHNETKVEVYNSFYLVYDGNRVKLTLLNDKFRDASRGLCGTFTGEPETDFADPQDCIQSDPEKFTVENTVSGKPKSAEKCYRKSVQFVKIVSTKDSGVVGYEDPSSTNTRLQTQYVVRGDKTCFSISPVPVCQRGYQPDESTSRKVPMHCIKSSRVTQLLRSQIDKGASPSFRTKAESMKINMRMTQSCSL